VTALAGIGVAAAVRPRVGLPLVLVLSLAASSIALAGAVSFDRQRAAHARELYLPADRSWIEHAHAGGPAAVLASPGTPRNPTARDAVLEPVGRPRTALARRGAARQVPEHARLRPDGTILDRGRPVRGTLLVDEQVTTVRLRGARRLTHWNAQTLVRPHGRARLAVVMPSRIPDGRLLAKGTLFVWPGARGGWLELRLNVPAALPSGFVRFQRPGGRDVTLRTAGGTSKRFRIPICGGGPWQSPFTAGPERYAASAIQTVRTSVPRFFADPAACG